MFTSGVLVLPKAFPVVPSFGVWLVPSSSGSSFPLEGEDFQEG